MPLSLLYRAAPFAAFVFLLAVFPQWPLARGVAAAILLAAFWRQYGEMRKPLAWRDVSASLAVGFVVFVVWISLDVPWATFGGERVGYAPVTPGGAIDWTRAIARLVTLIAIVPLMEELFWRSLLMRWIDARDFLAREPGRASITAVAVSSGLFALEHRMWLAGLVAGLAYARLYMTTNNLRAPVMAHLVTNAILGVWILSTGSWHLW
ncbi:MAG TPA: CAAX prenyl protease-related protein [Usitatibacter sp.]|nr:CAAX prenyl protease-related protein [Usitatibacter sp.]